MMDQFYGVVALEVLHTKGYSDFVQQTGPTISGQLRVSNPDAQILHNSSGVSQTKHEQYSPSLKPENYSGSAEHYCYSVLTNGTGLRNEKGSTSNAAYEMVPFLVHEENQEHPALEHDCFFSHLENQHLAKLQDNQPSSRGLARHLRRTKRHVQNRLYLSESVNSIAQSNPVQALGSMPRRFSSCRASSLNQLLRVILSDSAASFSCSRSSGFMRIWNAGDCPPDFGVRSFTLDIVHTFSFNGFYKVCTLYHEYSLKQTPPKGITSTRQGLTTTVKASNEAAMKDHTQTHPKFTWRFLALSANTRNVISITAATEREARDQSPIGCVMVFAGRLPAQEVRHA